MKISFLTIMLLSVTAAQASSICVATKNQQISYGSTMKYDVVCDSESFSSKWIMTSFLLPIPYNWGKAARKRLYTEMSAKGFSEIAQINKPKTLKGDDLKTLHIFDKVGTPATDVCAVLKYSAKTVGLEKPKLTYDAVFYCSGNTINETFSAVTQDEIDAHLKQKYELTEILRNKFKESYSVDGYSDHALVEFSIYRKVKK